jgi:hypothetical protein
VSEEARNADDADESASVTSAESAVSAEFADEVSKPVSVSAADLAQAAATRVGSHLQPAGCLTTRVTGSTVVYTLADCAGPYGLVHLTGTITAVYSHLASGAVQVVLTGTGIKANRSILDLDATATATLAAGIRSAVVVCDSSGTGPRGNTVSRHGEYTATYDSTSECIGIDGTWTTTSGPASASTVVTAYRRCKGLCPQAGGSIVHTTVGARVVTLSYDGSTTASWSTSGGRSGTVALVCTAS